MTTSEQKLLFLFDASSHFSRVYKKAVDEGALKNPKSFHNGDPVFALPSTVGNIINQLKAVCGILQKGYTNIAIVLDHEAETFRHVIYPNYKANRPPKPEDFTFQRHLLPEYIERSGFPVLKVAGVESDDVIGTIVTKALSSPNPPKIVIFTRDKDLLQLVSENVLWYDGKDLIGVNEVFDKKGVHPSQFVDYLTMIGDVSDNIQGVAGCGEKTARTILSQYTLDQVLDDPSLVEKTGVRTRKTVMKSISENKDAIMLTRNIIQLKCDVEIGTSMNQLVYKEQPSFTMTEFMKTVSL